MFGVFSSAFNSVVTSVVGEPAPFVQLYDRFEKEMERHLSDTATLSTYMGLTAANFHGIMQNPGTLDRQLAVDLPRMKNVKAVILDREKRTEIPRDTETEVIRQVIRGLSDSIDPKDEQQRKMEIAVRFLFTQLALIHVSLHQMTLQPLLQELDETNPVEYKEVVSQEKRALQIRVIRTPEGAVERINFTAIFTFTYKTPGVTRTSVYRTEYNITPNQDDRDTLVIPGIHFSAQHS